MTENIYLDYNATAPLASSVLNLLGQGFCDFRNPSSLHAQGRYAKKIVNEAHKDIKKFFSWEEDLFFHSGATEGLNSLFQGWTWSVLKQHFSPHLIFFPSDHSSVLKQKDRLEQMGAKVHMVALEKNGEFPLQDVVRLIQLWKKQDRKAQFLVNYMWVHNETGIVWDLAIAEQLKEQLQCFVSVDAVQSVGKVEGYRQLSPKLDAYTYSAHKFGGLKGVGLSLLKNGVMWDPTILGGGQQQAMRSGTENVLGIHSIMHALNDLQKLDIKTTCKAREEFEDKIRQQFPSSILIVGESAQKRSSQTTTLIFKEKKADFLLSFFDMNGVSISSGSACQSGTHKVNETLKALELEEYASSAVRFSFSFQGRDIVQHQEKLLALFGQIVS